MFIVDWQETLLKTDLPSNAKYLGMYLRTFMNAKSDIAWPSITRIERETGLCRSTVCKYLGVLEESGWITRERGTNGVNTRYHAHLPKNIEKLAASARDGLGSAPHGLSSARDGLGVVREADTNNQVNNQVITNNIEEPSVPCDLQNKSPPIPVQKIVNLYHETLPELPRMVKITKARRAQIEQRWREDLESLEDWETFFKAVRASDFLMGRTEKPFNPNLEWLTKAGNFAKIIEGKYHGNRQKPVEQPNHGRIGPTERTRRAREAAREKQNGGIGWGST